MLHNRSPIPNVPEVEFMRFYNYVSIPPSMRALHGRSASCGGKESDPNVAVLCRSNPLVARLSVILSEEHLFNARRLPPVEHDVLWDADLSAAAAQVVGSILEWPVKEPPIAVHDTARLIAHYYRIKNARVAVQGGRRTCAEVR